MTQHAIQKHQIWAIAKKIATLTAPPPNLSLSEWADRYRFLSRESSSEAGKWYTDRAPYQKGIMDAISDNQHETIVVMCSSQIGKTEIINNAIGYYVHQDPAPIMVVQATKDMAEAWSKDRLAPMVRDTPVLSRLITIKKRDGENTILHKKFAGGHITIAGSNSPASLASRPIRILLLDEVDRYPFSAGREGDPVNLAKKRTVTFFNRKIIMVSTPTVRGQSRIEFAYEQSNKSVYHVPCPTCYKKQPLIWANLHWTEGNPEEACYVCTHCGVYIEHGNKGWMLQNGEWIASNPSSKIAGFHLNELYSPWVSWGTMAEKFTQDKKNPDTLKTFVNTSLAETWVEDDEGEALEAHILLERAEDYEGLSEKILVITAGIDVQDDRIEYEIIGWGEDEESWSLDYGKIVGSPENKQVWDDLSDVLMQKFTHPIAGELGIAMSCIDTGGHHTDETYKYVRDKNRKGGLRICAIKGASQSGRPIVSNPSRKNAYKVKLYLIGTDTAKDTIFARFNIVEAGAGYCHFPMRYEESYFEGLTSEKVLTSYEKGKTTRKYVKKTQSIRNEPLDCRVYGLAALRILRPNFAVIAKRFAVKKREQNADIVAKAVKKIIENNKTEKKQNQTSTAPPDTHDKLEPSLKKTKKIRSPIRRRGGFVNRW